MKKYFALSLMALCAVSMESQTRLYENEFPLSAVTLTESPFRHAMDLNTEVLLKYDTDRLLAPYLKEAGLEPKGESFSCWDGLDGHVGGHYLSALAMHYAATGNPELKRRMDYMLEQLAVCAAANGNGYVGGVPNGAPLWEELRKGNVGKIWDYWVPWYNLHKMYAGLRDAWVYTGSKIGRNLFLGMCDWGLDIISGLTPEQMESMLNNEFGGMNEVYADAYAMTGEKKYLDAARKFTHHQLFDAMRDGVDNLDNRHANTQVPKAVGFQRVGETGGDIDQTRAARFFWETVTGNRSISIGGNSRREHFPSEADAKSYVDDREGPESCNTNNMLKLTEGLFRMSPQARYADYYERALFNHILSTQHPDHGGYVYFTPARPGHYRVYSQPNSAMWCCVGTGMENHGKYGQFIYTHSGPDSLYVNLFIPSILNWQEKGVSISQSTDFPATGATKLTVNTDSARRFTMLLRHPGWCDDVAVRINGKRQKISSTPSSYIALDREWAGGDVVELDMPMKFTVEELNHMPSYISILRGPIVMGSRVAADVPMPGLVADESRWAHIAGGQLVSVFDTPLLIGNRKDIVRKLNRLKPDSDDPMKFAADGIFESKEGNVVLEPFHKIHDSRYNIYWLSMTRGDYNRYQADARRDEAIRMALDKRTVDAVNTGEQQPEADHFMESRSSASGNFSGEPWRNASGGGFFSYRMRTGNARDLALRVRYWGNEQGVSNFDILVDDTPIVTENIVDRWSKDAFVEMEYPIPASLLENKENVTVKFSAKPGNNARSIYHVRLVRPE